MRDWREDYVICSHIAENPDIQDLRHSGFRVCCAKCDEEGFLTAELDKRKEGYLGIGTIKRKGEPQRNDMGGI